ncbi:uncharacterized protein ACA1_264280 [Acanthamoeba castellanii str. Neff]|uniref:Uncharacterized protein n=1 Tax=Acanthamoeba castellanii (strain ATCC 30010 / Neff) TaxID=1257118 RepID=L8H217_ACACF|nr:uncharacterized protein ACA1_264280 [Acanthamoeba castellanii str. Neff]ELR19257.1 hypothetical protein ACA1_264280 [Acanthamoeba castellanii str. Neff]
MADDAEVARLMRAMGGGGGGERKEAAAHPSKVPISPRGHTTDLEENLEGMTKEEARLLRSMHTTTGKATTAHAAAPAPAKKWADPVAAKPVPPPENVVREDTHHQQTAAAAVHAEPVVQQREPVVEHRARPNHPEEEALVEVVADPEALKQKEEEQAAKEASRMERLLAKKFIV